MLSLSKITSLIPHRPPFLWVDKVLEYSAGSMIAEKAIPKDLDIFEGHYPENPILPGVILCEAVFQTGALLIAKILEDDNAELLKNGQALNAGVPVLTRIGGARFKRSVSPGDIIQMHVKLKEKVAGAWFMKGTIKVKEKMAVQVEFSCAMTPATTQA
ncbi:MAG: beta-hydroxyacyl-ACP dehydratase [Desulfobulbaceae bacterium]|uniref:Beta-hydroxyacyl-ACP dehydratase n=1 Tax=Candidatus Desulfatifera sulfidica TaxID=2841691 RepID=A0A8J6NBB1_9BACT|nr:beta-hydroxyacyl-ACP dehydratase [Candidatus Desulfatifera sulfidica]